MLFAWQLVATRGQLGRRACAVRVRRQCGVAGTAALRPPRRRCHLATLQTLAGHTKGVHSLYPVVDTGITAFSAVPARQHPSFEAAGGNRRDSSGRRARRTLLWATGPRDWPRHGTSCHCHHCKPAGAHPSSGQRGGSESRATRPSRTPSDASLVRCATCTGKQQPCKLVCKAG